MFSNKKSTVQKWFGYNLIVLHLNFQLCMCNKSFILVSGMQPTIATSLLLLHLIVGRWGFIRYCHFCQSLSLYFLSVFVIFLYLCLYHFCMLVTFVCVCISLFVYLCHFVYVCHFCLSLSVLFVFHFSPCHFLIQLYNSALISPTLWRLSFALTPQWSA